MSRIVFCPYCDSYDIKPYREDIKVNQEGRDVVGIGDSKYFFPPYQIALECDHCRKRWYEPLLGRVLTRNIGEYYWHWKGPCEIKEIKMTDKEIEKYCEEGISLMPFVSRGKEAWSEVFRAWKTLRDLKEWLKSQDHVGYVEMYKHALSDVKAVIAASEFPPCGDKQSKRAKITAAVDDLKKALINIVED